MAFGFLTNKEAQEKIQALEARITELEENAKLADAEISQARSEASGSSAEIAPMRSQIAELSEKLDAATTQITAKDAEIAKLKEDATATAEKISIEASRQLAASGHPTPVSVVEDAIIPTNHLATLQTLSGEARTAYYAAHEAEIRAELTK